jgi:hypothetical protein
MALFQYTLTDQDIGTVLPVENGFLVNLSQSAPSTDRDDPQYSISLGRYLTGYLQLRGSRDPQAIYCNRSGQWTPLWSGDNRVLVTDQSLGFNGRLVVQCVPRGASYALTLSDVPYVAPLPADVGLGGPHVRNRKDGTWGSTTPRP